MAFLRSWYGEKLRQSGYFRLMSDMGRPAEEDGQFAGAHLVAEINRLGFTIPMMIFTGNSQKGIQKLQEKAPRVHSSIADGADEPSPGSVLVTDRHGPALAFCSFLRLSTT
eukprot:224698-Amphidinium_carterae.1